MEITIDIPEGISKERVAQLLSDLIETDKFTNITTKYDLIRAILKGYFKDEPIIKNLMHNLHIKPCDKYYVLAIDTKQTMLSKTNVEILSSYIRADIYYISDLYIALIGKPMSEDILESDFPKLSTWLESNDYYSGVSQGFLHLSQAPGAIQQCQSIIPLRHRISGSAVRMARYEDLQLGHMVHIMNTHGVPLMSFVHPILQNIWNYDTKNDTNFFLTLMNYVICNKSISKTAEIMHLHKNTITYRINQLKDNFYVNLNNQRFILKVYIAGSVYNYLYPDKVNTLHSFESIF